MDTSAPLNLRDVKHLYYVSYTETSIVIGYKDNPFQWLFRYLTKDEEQEMRTKWGLPPNQRGYLLFQSPNQSSYQNVNTTIFQNPSLPQIQQLPQSRPFNPPPLSYQPEANELEPEVMETIIGYRRWIVKDGLIYPMNEQFGPWKPGVQKASCKLQSHYETAPSADCHCGIYVSKRTDLIPPFTIAGSEKTVFGAVQLWGKVIEHEEGYRGQYARILLFVDENKRFQSLAEKYGVATTNNFKSLPLIAREMAG